MLLAMREVVQESIGFNWCLDTLSGALLLAWQINGKPYLTPVASLFVDISTTSSVGHGTSEVSEEMVEKLSSVDAGEENRLSRAVVEGRFNNYDFFSNLTHHLSKSEK